MDFVHLHLHTNYSLLNGVCKIKDLAEKLEQIGQKAVAITDHFNLFGAIKFYEELKKRGIKPIIGCEINVELKLDLSLPVEERFCHLVVLCENKKGYENLVKIVSFANLKRVNKTAIINFNFLRKHKEGLIFLSGCLKGIIAKYLFYKGYDYAKKVAVFLREEFSKDYFFLEMQYHGLMKEKLLNDAILNISKETGLEVVATNNVHYLEKKDALTKEVLGCIKNFKVLDLKHFKKNSSLEYYLKTFKEMEEIFSNCKQAIINTNKIAKRCNFDFEFGKIYIPNFKTDENISSKDFLIKKAKKGLLLKYGKNPSKEIIKRFCKEINVIVKMGFVDYFLIVCDYVQYAKNSGILVGPGRGSGAGSLIGFCLGITEVDPIKYNLSFDRFLNIYRAKMPDFDIDFCNEKRQMVIDYVIEKYGSENVARIITFGSLAAKAAVRDVGRVLGLSYDFVDGLIKMFPFKHNITLKEALSESLSLKQLFLKDENVKLLFKISMQVEGLLKNTSIHAAAIVITKQKLDEIIPLYKTDNIITTQYSMQDIEKLGILKMDFLGLRNLTILSKCEKLIKEREKNFSIFNISFDDEKTFKMLSIGDSIGVFQLESFGMRMALKKIMPKCLEDVMALLALNRPGPSRFIDEYVKNRKKYNGIKFLNKNMGEILNETYGVIVYQEQVLKIFKDIAGDSMQNIDRIRRIISKKEIEKNEEERNFFVYGRTSEQKYLNCVGAVNNGILEKDALKIFDSLLKFALYAFNKSHAAAYSIISYKTAYLKCNYFIEYMVCLLNSVINNKDKLKIYIRECKEKNVKILSVDVNFSEQFFKMEDENAIRIGFLAVKNVSLNLANLVVKERNKKNYVSLEDFLVRILYNENERDVSKNAIKSLKEAGAFLKFGEIKNFDGFFENVLQQVKFKKREIKGQLSLFENFKDKNR